MTYLLKALKKYRLQAILGPLFKLLEASFELLVPLAVASIIDDGIGAGDKMHVFKMAAVMALLALIGYASAVSAQYFAAHAAVGSVSRLRRDLFAKLETLSFSQIDALGTSKMITRLTSDLNQVQSGVNLTLRLFLRSPFIVFGSMVMAMTIDLKSSLTFVSVIPLLSVVVFGIMLLTMPLYKKVQSKLDKLTLSARENVIGVRVIRAFCSEERQKADFSEKSADFCAHQRRVGRISALLNPITYVMINFAVIALVYIGAIRVDNGILSQGQVIALYNYMSQILVELIKLADLIINMTKAGACLSRVSDVLDLESDEIVPENPAETDENAPFAIRFERASLTYAGDGAPVLSDIDFGIRKGQSVGVIGGTGSGKTSLVHLIPRFYPCTEGKVLLGGADVKELSPEVLRKKVGIVMQNAVLFKGTIRENLLWGNENASEEELWEAIDSSAARDVVEAKGGLDAMIETNGRNLSGGQRQRLSIARTLLSKPEILILDDSGSALDFATDARLRRNLGNLPYKPTVIIVSQRISCLSGTDFTVVLDNGKIAGIGTHDELMKTCPVYREIANSQNKETGGETA